jgi:hypothetical protein
MRAYRQREGQRKTDAQGGQAVKEPIHLTAASLARLREVREAVMHGRRYTLDAADIISEDRERHATH